MVCNYQQSPSVQVVGTTPSKKGRAPFQIKIGVRVIVSEGLVAQGVVELKEDDDHVGGHPTILEVRGSN
jgi:hypothetical protein